VTEVKTGTLSVYKYPMEYTERQVVELPEGAEILHVGDQLGTVCVWAKINPDLPANKKYMVTIVGTGQPCPEDLDECTFLGTVVQQQLAMTEQGPRPMSFVWHFWGKWV